MKEYSPGSAEREANRIMAERMDRLGRAGGLELFKRVSDRTPVDTGRARANWNTTVGPSDFTTDEGTDESAAKAMANTAVAAFNLGQGDVLRIANGLPYIEELEDGSSLQAPAGMVKVVVHELGPWIRRQARRLNRG